MSRYSGGLRTGAGTTALPIISLYSPAGSGGVIREIGVFNASAVAVELAVRRFTTAGTAPAETEMEYAPDLPPPLMVLFGTHTVGPTIASGLIRSVVLGAAAGSGVIWTFGGTGLVIEPGVTNGIGIVVQTGTGQICQAYIDWEE